MKKVLCIDIGGTFIKTAICNGNKKLNNLKRLKASRDEIEFYNLINNIIREAISFEEISAISFCLPAVIKENKITKCRSYPFLEYSSFFDELNDTFYIPVYIENDGNCAALSEISYGKYNSYKDMIFIIIGTGIGGAIIKDGNIHYGSNYYAGEFGCMYFLINGSYEKLSHLASISSCINKIKIIYPDEDWTGEKLFYQAKLGNIECQKVVDDFFLYLSLAILNMQHIYDPEIFLIGGGISERKDLQINLNKYMDKMIDDLKDFSLLRPKIDIITFNKDANLYGAYIKATKKHQNEIFNFKN